MVIIIVIVSRCQAKTCRVEKKKHGFPGSPAQDLDKSGLGDRTCRPVLPKLAMVNQPTKLKVEMSIHQLTKLQW